MFSYQYSPYAIPLGISALISVYLIAYIYKQRHSLGAIPGMATIAALMIWSAGYMLEILGADLSTKVFWAKIQYFGIVGLPFFYLLFSLEFAEQKKWITRVRLAFISIIPIATLFLVFTNEYHLLIWPDWYLEEINGALLLHLEHGIAFWINISYVYVSLIASTILIIRAVTKRPELYRKQITAILIGVVAPWIGNAISNFGLLSVPIDLTPFGFTVTGLAIAWGIFRHDFLNIAPIAHEAVFRNINEAVIVLDIQNNIVDINLAAQSALGISARDVVGKQAKEIFSDYEDITERFSATMNTQEEITLEDNGRTLYYEISISPLFDEKKNTLGRAIVLHDISAIKEAAGQMQDARDVAIKANQIKSEFLAMISHELRTPLGVIRGYADLLGLPDYGDLSELQTKAVSEIISGTERVSNMVDELLDEARLTAGAVELDNQLFSPEEVLHHAKETLGVLAEKKKLQFNTEADDELPPKIYGDLSRLLQITTNLVANAIKFTEEGSITLTLKRKNEIEWLIEVKDTGTGISTEAIQTIFEPFSQADNTITRKYGGTGLGLSIVNHLVHLMNGKISVESEIDRGSTFTVSLPLLTEEIKGL